MMKQTIKVKYQIGLSENFIDTNFVIFSHDKNTVELYIELNKHMDIVKVLFTGAGIYAERTAEQVADRPARYTVPFDSSLIRTSTPVTAYIYGYLDNDQSYDIGAVRFYVSPSAIDTLQPEEKEYYFEKLEGLMEGFENIFAQAEIARNEYEEQRQLAEEERVTNYLDWTDPETGLEARVDAKIEELNDIIFEEIGYFAGENITISNDFVISAKDTVYDDTSIVTALGNKVEKDGNKVLSTYDYDATAKGKVDAIPVDPKYTDTNTVYSAGSNVSIDANNVISAENTVYDDTSIVTSLGDKLDRSGDTLNSYREKLSVITSGSIDLAAANVFKHVVSADTTYVISNAVDNVVHSFTLYIYMPVEKVLTFDSGVKWQGGEAPVMDEKDTVYETLFTTLDGGDTWFAGLGGTYDVS